MDRTNVQIQVCWTVFALFFTTNGILAAEHVNPLIGMLATTMWLLIQIRLNCIQEDWTQRAENIQVELNMQQYFNSPSPRVHSLMIGCIGVILIGWLVAIHWPILVPKPARP